MKHQRLTRKSIMNDLVALDSSGKINLSKVQNSLHYNRIVENILDESISSSYDELFDPELLSVMINSRHYNWTRPLGAPLRHELPDIFEDGRVLQ